jgi:DNA-binding CsgD family transcriptional regulator/tetratricopeptide (TPR) repeat protein
MPRATSATFVGRAEELGALTAGLDRAVAGEPVAFLVGGEAGVGKTRLVDELARHAEMSGAQVISGGCIELTGGGAPLLPVVEALRGVPEQVGWADWLALVGDARSELARLIPELGEPAPAPDQGLAQSRLLELLLGVVRRLADRAPLVWIVEDAHWADPSTRDLLSFVVRNLRHERLLLVSTFREDEAERREPLQRWLSWIGRVGGVERIDLSRFARPELDALLAGVLGMPPSRDLAEQVFERSEGNAFIAEELAAARDGPAIPATLHDVLLARLSQVGEDARQTVRVAAAIGQRIDHDLLATVTGLPDDRLLEALREAVRHRLLAPQPDARTYGFRHALMREAAAAELLPGERERLHALIAEILTARPELGVGSPATVSGAVAHHWRAARIPDRALVASVHAASEAAATHAFAAALELLEQALDSWESVPGAATLVQADRPALRARAAEAAALTGRNRRAVELSDAALRELDEHAEPVRAGVLHARRGWYLFQGGYGLEEALPGLHRAIELIPPAPPSLERVEALSKLARALVLNGCPEEGRRRATEALEPARSLGARAVESELLNSLGLSAANLGWLDEGVARLREALVVALQAGDPDGIGLGYTNLSSLLGTCCRFDEAIEVALEGADACRRLGIELTHGLFCLGNAAENLIDLGRYDEAERVLATALDHDVGESTRFHLHLMSGQLAAGQGRHDVAERHLELARALGATDYSLEFRAHEAHAAGLIALERGRPLEVRGRCAEVMALAARAGDEWTGATLLSLGLRGEADIAERSRARRRAGEEDAARAAAAALAAAWCELRARLDPRRTASPEVQAHTLLAEAERTRLDGASDPERWATAQAAWDRLGMQHRAAYARWRRADALLAARGNRAEAAALLGEAFDACVRMGAESLRREVEVLARRARIELAGPAAAPHTGAPTEPSAAAELGLTAREIEVLAQLVEGRTNREIADALFISVKTAGAHVSSILRKLDASTRGQAAVIALSGGLLPDRAGDP